MVHFKPILKSHKVEPYHRKYQKDTYWMLGFYLNKTIPELKAYLDTHGYYYSKGTTKPGLIDAVSRSQRGLLSYEEYSIEDLRAFCRARALTFPPRTRVVSRLARILQQADNDVQFRHFFQLPAELRTKIYELHFSDYDDEITTQHRQPPLTLVLRLRAEALPVFYNNVTFSWDLALNTNWCFDAHFFSDNTLELLKLPAENLAQIRNFKLHWTHVHRGYGGHATRRVDFIAHASQRNNVTKAFAILDPTGEAIVGRREGRVGEVLRRWLDGMEYWGVDWELRLSDLRAVEKLVNEVMRQKKR